MVTKIGQRSVSSFEVKQQATVTPQPKQQPAAPQSPSVKFGNEFSSGRGSALRAKALAISGGVRTFASRPAFTESEGAGGGVKWPRGPLTPSQEVQPGVEIMQNRLVALGYLDASAVGSNAGVYGPMTEDAVELFQRANGLEPTGIADPETLRLMAATSSTWSDVVSELDAEIIGAPIGEAGEAPVPTLDTLESQTMIGNTEAWVRDNPDVDEAAQDTRIPAGTPVTVTDPQPDGGEEGWLHVTAEVDGELVTGWVMDGASGYDRVVQSTDPRVDQRLEDLGYLAPDTVTNEAAIRNYQLMNGLPATGELDDATLASMWSADAVTSNHLRQVVNPQWNHNSPNASSNDCGPTATAMALAAVGLSPIDNADPASAISTMREAMGGTSSDKTGTGDIEDGIAAAGGTSYQVDTTDEVMLAVANGDPVVLYGWNEEYETYHWVTVQGYDPETKTWLVSDPLSADGVAQWTQEEFDDYVSYDVPSVAVENPN